MRISEEKDKYLNYYFNYISPGGKESNVPGSRESMIQALQTMAEMKGEGAEYISCSFDPEGEDYIENKVTLFFWKPAIEEDTMVIVDNSMFYEYLVKTCNNHISKFPDDVEIVGRYLEEIKVHLKI